jgi:CO/xanthine dehydrogenase Mo-binding subunit
VAADVLAMPWEKVEVAWGNTGKGLPWTCMSVGSQTTHAMTRANHAGAMDAKRKLQEFAARDLGGAPDDYDLGNERVYRKGQPGRALTYAQAAERAIQLGRRYDGHELPPDIHPVTKNAAAGLVGLGLMGVAKDTYPRDGATYSFVAGFAEVEVDLETGAVRLVDFLSVGDVGLVVNPRSLVAQINGGVCLGIAHALCQRLVYDRTTGCTARRFAAIAADDPGRTPRCPRRHWAFPSEPRSAPGRGRAAGGRWAGAVPVYRRCGRRGCVPPGARDVRRGADVDHAWPADARAPPRAYLERFSWLPFCPRRRSSSCSS